MVPKRTRAFSRRHIGSLSRLYDYDCSRISTRMTEYECGSRHVHIFHTFQTVLHCRGQLTSYFSALENDSSNLEGSDLDPAAGSKKTKKDKTRRGMARKHPFAVR